MKLNYKRTILVGFAFFLICHFWQAYDTIIPKILTDKFGMSQTWSGVIMALDNVLALFMLPFFGALSDKSKSKRGKRTPFIVIGTLAACCALLLLCFADSLQTAKVASVDPFKDKKAALETLYEADPEIQYQNKLGMRKHLSEIYHSEEEFVNVEFFDADGKTTDDYDHVVRARQAYAAEQTRKSPAVLVMFIVVLLILLVAMGFFRSPAVALMPDVTPKPLRSKGNAIINLMGAAGGILILVLGILLGTGKIQNSLMNYSVFFMIVTAVMLGSLLVFVLTVKEPLWAKEADDDYKKYYPEEAEKEPMDETPKDRKLSKGEKLSLILILASVALWFMGYNAVTSKFSVYAVDVLKKDFNMTLIVAQAAAILSYIPVGILSSRFGRKKAILFGVGLLTVSFITAATLTSETPAWVMTAMFVLAGIGWATINVNSFPMVVELSTGSNTGKYTGYYYTASMAAQTVTPIFSGVFLDMDMRSLFPYAAIFTGLSFVTMLFVKHGDSKPLRKSALESIGEGED